ncbi:MAG: hypothetical protein ACJAYV_000327 [Oleispira sp.]|jgi:hypothetical protein
MKYLLLILALVCTPVWAGSIEVFEREYTYNASENDSKVSARKAAMLQLQTLVIQEVGVQVQSSFSQKETLEGDDFNRQVQANYKTFSQALTKTRILKQTWDGENFYIKAQITVDTDNLLDQIKLVYVDSSNAPAKKQNCKTVHNHAIDLLAEANKPEIVAEIVKYSAQYPIDEKCYRWQLGILNNFRSLELDPAGYRGNLFQRIEKEGSSYVGDLMVDVLQYALSIRELSESEWAIVKTAMQRSSSSNIQTTISYLIKSTKAEGLAEADKRTKHINQAYQTVDGLLQKMDEILVLAGAGKLGSPKTVDVESVTVSFLEYSSKNMPNLFFKYYTKNSYLIDKDTTSDLIDNVLNLYKDEPTSERLVFLNTFIKDIEPKKSNNKFLFSFFLELKNNKRKVEVYPAALESLLKDNSEFFGQLIATARYNKKKKEQLLIEYNLPAKGILSVEGYAEQLFDKNTRNQIEAAQYLVAFNERAKPIKSQVVKRLSRIKALKKVSTPRNLMVELMQILDNIDAHDKATVEMLVWAISDLDGEVNKKAQATLEGIGAQSLPHIVSDFAQQKPTAQRRLVEVVGTFNSKKKEALKFLKTVKPSTEQLRFALEDSIAALQS